MMVVYWFQGHLRSILNGEKFAIKKQEEGPFVIEDLGLQRVLVRLRIRIAGQLAFPACGPRRCNSVRPDFFGFAFKGLKYRLALAVTVRRWPRPMSSNSIRGQLFVLTIDVLQNG
jgi:hypothetical protein